MPQYKAPVDDIMATMKYSVGFERMMALKDQSETNEDLVSAITEEAAKFAENVLAPTNEIGDQQGATRRADGGVDVPQEYKDAYQQFCDMGWGSLSFDANYGGQGLPWSVNFMVQEMWQSANMAFGLCPMLTQGAIEAITQHGSQEQKDLYLEKLVSGEWTGTMNLTEPAAGSDLGALKAKAVKQADGTYKISGQKIYITFGEHDMSENIIHLVLARTEDAPEGVKGISMFIVPKFDVEGGANTKNDVKCTSIEHKLGIHGSPTCTMQFGDDGGATGYLIGAENEGLKYMFTMMNNARLAVGLQGVSIAERAYQHALDYANERTQGKSLETGKDNAPIVEHPDVDRMLTDMRAKILAGRLLTAQAVMGMDEAHMSEDQATKEKGQLAADLLTPIVKAWCTDRGVEIASQGLQVMGGMGFIEEGGAAQFYRDARILPIYEGTNGIQAMDLVFRKTLRDGGQGMLALLDDLKARFDALSQERVLGPEELQILIQGMTDLKDSVIAIKQMGAHKATAVDAASAGHDYLTLCGNVIGGIYLAEMAVNASKDNHAKAHEYEMLATLFTHQNVSASSHLKHRIQHNLRTIRAKQVPPRP